ncbi:signal peptidase I, partial [Bordetella pertussis]
MSWNFALILFVLLVITGVIWGLDLALFRKRRERRAQAAAAQVDAAGITDAEQAGRE